MGLGLSIDDGIFSLVLLDIGHSYFLSIGSAIYVHGRSYRILDVVGQGGEATVYRCKDRSGHQHAVKAFYFSRYPPHQLPQQIDGFIREARILKYLSGRSPHFVQLVDYEYKPEENVGYMVMELGSGSLRQHLQGFPLNDQARRMYWKQIVEILRALEDARIGKRYFLFISISSDLYLKYMLISNLII
jgi:serine/threonine protein kinase